MTKKILFIPVSSEKGIGEYIRSLIVANKLKQEHAQIDIAFVLNKHAPYYHQCPFKVFGCDSSPTKDSKKVIQHIDNFSPDLAVFDASGRVAQLKHCHTNKIKTLFIAQHERKLKQGLRWRRLRYIDQICVVQPAFLLPELSFWDKYKLKMLNKPLPVYCGPVFAEPSSHHKKQMLAKFQLLENRFILFNAGSGGHMKQGINAAEEFVRAAECLSQTTKMQCVVVLGPSYMGSVIDNPNLRVIKSLSPEEFNALLSQCGMAILTGGGALLYGIHCGKKIVASAVSADQPSRIKRCEAAGLMLSSPLSAKSLADSASMLISQDEKRYHSGINNGVTSILNTIGKLVKSS